MMLPGMAGYWILSLVVVGGGIIMVDEQREMEAAIPRAQQGL
jgi:hypothetical protein